MHSHIKMPSLQDPTLSVESPQFELGLPVTASGDWVKFLQTQVLQASPSTLNLESLVHFAMLQIAAFLTPEKHFLIFSWTPHYQ
jgi:hypothetical protein